MKKMQWTTKGKRWFATYKEWKGSYGDELNEMRARLMFLTRKVVLNRFIGDMVILYPTVDLSPCSLYWLKKKGYKLDVPFCGHDICARSFRTVQ